MSSATVNTIEFGNWAEERFDAQGISRFSNDSRRLEVAIRSPIKDEIQHLIRRVQLANLRASSLQLRLVDRHRSWFGTKFHFPNLVVESAAMQDGDIATTSLLPFIWLDMEAASRDAKTPLPANEQISVIVPALVLAIPDHIDSSSNTQATNGLGSGEDDDTSIATAAGPIVLYELNAFQPSWALSGIRPPTNPAVATFANNHGIGIEPNSIVK
ncbi:hypothetical protein WAI453_009300 [Rhynchosporium graminicola]